ncbi:MAG: MBOAT family O-acyltransferase [Dysgonomonas sp.]
MLESILSFFNKDEIISWFVYDPSNPLMFNTTLFWGIFVIFFGVYSITKNCRTFRTIYVLLFSLFYYYKVGGFFVLLLIASVLFNFIFSESMDLSTKQWKRRLYLTFTIVINLGVLGYYKYTNFFIDNINSAFSTNFALHHIILPIGISFYTFQAISYSIDLYRKQMKPAKSILDFAFYLCFFPQLVAGPIVRAKVFLPQMRNKMLLTKKDAALALFMIMMGLIKKSVISDYISLNFIDRIYDDPLRYTSIENLLATYGYTIQIYCDFSGYSDIAIGLALLMGFKLPPNFHTPYKSGSVTEFWKRWHISLSSWLRDYLYIPLGGNRKGKVRTYINLFLTMLIGGLWHGASWKFIVWGGLHGIALAIERFFKQFIKLPNNFVVRLICIVLTFHFVSFCWIFFRADSFETAEMLISNIGRISFNPDEWIAVIEAYKNVFILMLIGYTLHFLPERFVNWVKKGFQWLPFPIMAIIFGFVFWLVYATATSGPQPFIYFKF